MFKFLIFIFLIQLVHWSVVSGTEPTAFGTDRDDIETALKAGVSTDPTAASGTCIGEETAYDVIKPCVVPLNTLSTIATVPIATQIPVKPKAANYYLIQSLLEKDSTFNDAKLNGLCAGIKKTTDCIAASIAPAPASGGDAGPCNGIATTEAALAIANFKAQYKLFYSVETFCTAEAKKAAFTDPFAADTNKYSACKLTPSGILMEAAFLEAVNHILGLPDAAAIADLKAIINAGATPGDALKTLKLKSMCYNVQAAYNKVFRVYFQEKDKFTTDCDEATVKLTFNLIKAVIPPGVENACTLPDPVTTLPLAATKPNPQGTPRKEVAILSYQHIKYHRRATADADKFVSCLDNSLTNADQLLFEYGNVKLQGDYDSTDDPNLFLKSVKVTIGTATYTAPANTDPTLPAATGAIATSVVVDGLKATFTDTASGLLIIVNKVVSTATPPKGIYGVTVGGSQSVMDLSAGSMYSGCSEALNEATGLNAGTLAAIKTYDNGKQAGAGDLATAVEAAIVASTSTTAAPTTAASDSCFIKASLSCFLFAAAIVKICIM